MTPQGTLFDDDSDGPPWPRCRCDPNRPDLSVHAKGCPLWTEPARFDKGESEERREEAIARAGAAADSDWKVLARKAIEQLARARETFTTDDVWKLLPADVAETHEPRALGAIMRAAARDGIIEATDEWTLSEQVSCHRRPKRVWRSLVGVDGLPA